MTQNEGSKPDQQITAQQRKSAIESKAPVRSSVFKYYIHDSVESLGMQLFGELSEAEVRELAGCWATARTILAGRPLRLDLRNLKNVDHPGKQWIISMMNEGAVLLPETFLRDEAATHSAQSQSATPSFFARLFGSLRGSRSIPEPSSTQAQ